MMESNPSVSKMVRQAIQSARAGRRTEARDLLLEVVESDPRNEIAWMWLSGLVDSLEDRMIACENVLTINPANQKVRAYLSELQRQHQAFLARKNVEEAVDLLNQARGFAERNDVDSALRSAWQAVEKHDGYEEAWLFIGRISPDPDQQIAAFEKAGQLNPSNPESASALQQAKYLKANPISRATQLEQLGKFEDALIVYKELAGKAKNSREFDQIYKQIIRIEGLRNENIRFVAPSSSIQRLTFVWPLLYLSLALIQVGLNPVAHPAFYLWLGLPVVILGSFLLSLAEVRSNHIVWQKLFSEHGDGSDFARLITAAAGWFLVIVPHGLMIVDSMNRLQNFKVPAMPF
jgi:tetratricopeptide (TPR) repeat protein